MKIVESNNVSFDEETIENLNKFKIQTTYCVVLKIKILKVA